MLQKYVARQKKLILTSRKLSIAGDYSISCWYLSAWSFAVARGTRIANHPELRPDDIENKIANLGNDSWETHYNGLALTPKVAWLTIREVHDGYHYRNSIKAPLEASLPICLSFHEALPCGVHSLRGHLLGIRRAMKLVRIPIGMALCH